MAYKMLEINSEAIVTKNSQMREVGWRHDYINCSREEDNATEFHACHNIAFVLVCEGHYHGSAMGCPMWHRPCNKPQDYHFLNCLFPIHLLLSCLLVIDLPLLKNRHLCFLYCILVKFLLKNLSRLLVFT